MIHRAVTEAFKGFTVPLEGQVPHMYVDILGLVTCGVGNLVDPIDAAVRVQGWTLDGRPATADEVRRDWLALKGEDERRLRDGSGQTPLRKLQYKYAAPYTRVRLTDDAINTLVRGKLASNVKHMAAKHFPAFSSWPADAQLAACSLAWAVGPDWPVKFPNCKRLCLAQDWAGCIAGIDSASATQTAGSWAAKIREAGNPGVVPRNRHNALCLSNAAYVKAHGLRLDVLHWPEPAAAHDAPETAVIEVPEAGAPESFRPPIVPPSDPNAGTGLLSEPPSDVAPSAGFADTVDLIAQLVRDGLRGK